MLRIPILGCLREQTERDSALHQGSLCTLLSFTVINIVTVTALFQWEVNALTLYHLILIHNTLKCFELFS